MDVFGDGLRDVDFDEAVYPPVVTARAKALREDPASASSWTTNHKPVIELILLRFGVVTFRGFGLRAARDFDAFLSSFEGHGAGYAGGTSPRGAVSGRVMQSTQAPPDREILLHQEMAYTRDFPKRLAFFCEVPPESGGETLIGDMRRFTREVPNAFFDRVKRLGVRYVRRFRHPDWMPGHPDLDLLHRSWADAFGSESREEAEAACLATGSDCVWTPHGLEASFVTKGYEIHPQTGEEIWFNVIPAFDLNAVSQGQRFQALHEEFYGTEHPWPQAVMFGDGSEISPQEIAALYPVMNAATTAPKWQHGDVQLLDNILTGHGRATFTGQRLVRVMLLA
ncbi:TauD/TfdA family dioxygenase [Novosphingobium aquimarinum]|uniref:TauD/TfdA family dioxygenase n=1 Tax=Novosphingobium aquimarinum TaxID=2682494 RepID=UPI0018DBDD7E|nr:TauD/TfdA family dioxygenase [Novosphingobium aquimarinum]